MHRHFGLLLRCTAAAAAAARQLRQGCLGCRLCLRPLPRLPQLSHGVAPQPVRLQALLYLLVWAGRQSGREEATGARLGGAVGQEWRRTGFAATLRSGSSVKHSKHRRIW